MNEYLKSDFWKFLGSQMNKLLMRISTLSVTALCLFSMDAGAIGMYTGTFEIDDRDYTHLLTGETYAFMITVVNAPDELSTISQNNHGAISDFSLTKTGGSGTWPGFSSSGGNTNFQFFPWNDKFGSHD
ncbi:hypothetical protein P0Y35_05020 [Kiritimatiellaeota bacterium B1221]|nr:hypothetical protein [Kiritimatiellaeota bacterium B1221]